jgi:hypothetical protein
MSQSDRTAEERSHTGTDVSRRHVLTAVGFGGAVALAGCAGVGDAERETTDVQYDVTGDVETVTVDADDGDTTIEPWDRDVVRIEATKYAVGQTELSDIGISRDVTDGRLGISEENDTGLIIGSGGGGLESLTVRVPAGVRVTELDIDDGGATMRDVAGDLTLSVDDGDVDIGSLDGTVDIDGDDADVTVGEVDGLSAELDDGTVDLAVSGVADDSVVEAGDGDVTVRLSSSLDATVVCDTDDGSVRTEGDMFDGVESVDDPFRGRIGEGGDRLSITVDDGRISLEPLS